MVRGLALGTFVVGSLAVVAFGDPAPVTKMHDASAVLTELLARTDSVAKEVAKVRALPLKRPIPNEVIDKAELHDRLMKMASDGKTAAETAAEALALARWGMIPSASDYEKLVIDVLNEQIAGYYDPKTKKLTISKSVGDDREWAELVLAHEIDHGLQDQSFDLKKFEDLPQSEGDAAMARHALVEGDGIAVMFEVMLTRLHRPVQWSPELSTMIEKALAASGNDDALDKAPLAIREAMIFPYRAGFAFVAALRRRQPWSAVDAAFRRPPKSTEQIIHPERYLADDQPIPIAIAAPAALPGYTIAHNTVWGELGFDLFLRAHGVDASVAAEAAAGWGGDRVAVLTKTGDTDPEHAVGIARFDWDSEADAIEAIEAGTRALDNMTVGTVIERGQNRMRWVGADGTASWIERRGPALVMVIGAPMWSADKLLVEAWTATKRK
jgi:hypothetical protein